MYAIRSYYACSLAVIHDENPGQLALGHQCANRNQHHPLLAGVEDNPGEHAGSDRFVSRKLYFYQNVITSYSIHYTKLYEATAQASTPAALSKINFLKDTGLIPMTKGETVRNP